MIAALAALALLCAVVPAYADPISVSIITAVAGAAAATSTAVAITTFALTTALSVGLSYAAKALAPKPKKAAPTSTDFGTTITQREALAARRLVYGRSRVPGTIAYMTATSGNRYLHLVLALCEGPIDAVETVYFNDEAVPVDASGAVTSGTYQGKARVKIVLGSPAQPADADLIAESGGQWTAAHRLAGVAYLYVRLEWDQNVYVGGLPNITAIVRGRLVYDPRAGTTAWSDNPALCLRDFLTRARRSGGVGAPPNAIDDANFAAQANICDETVPTAGGGVEKRYTCNGAIDLDDGNAPQQTVESMLTACGGRLTWSSGSWRLYVATWRAATAAITDALLRGDLQGQTRQSLRQQFNAVKGTYLNPAARYVPADYPGVIGAAFETEDAGERVYKDLPLRFTTSPAMAQRLAKIELYRARKPITVTAPCTLAAYGITVGDTITVTHERYGWIAKPFEVIGWKWAVDADGPALGIDLTLRETASAIYDWLASEEQLAQSQPSTTLPVWKTVETPTGLGAISNIFLATAAEGTRSRTVVTWTAAQSSLVFAYDVRYRRIDPVTGADPTWTPLARTTDPRAVIYDLPSGTYEFNVRCVNAALAVSAWATKTQVIDAIYRAPLVDVDLLRPDLLDQSVLQPIFSDDLLEAQTAAALVVARRSWEVGDRVVGARVTETVRLVADTNQALASLQTSVDAQFGSVGAQVTANQTAISDVAGQVFGQWAVQVVTQTQAGGGSFKKVSGFALIQSGGGGTVTSEFNIEADRFNVLPATAAGTGATKKPVFTIGTVGGVTGQAGLNGNLFVDGSITARSLAVTSLAAVTANMGTLTAGKVQSPDGKFLVDCDNKRIVVSD